MGCAVNGAPIWAESRLHLPRWLLMRVLAYRLQVAAFGGLDKSIRGCFVPRRVGTPSLNSTDVRLRPETASA